MAEICLYQIAVVLVLGGHRLGTKFSFFHSSGLRSLSPPLKSIMSGN